MKKTLLILAAFSGSLLPALAHADLVQTLTAIAVESQTATVTPTFTLTVTPTPVNTGTDTLTVTPTLTASPTVTPTITKTSTISPTGTYTSTASPTATNTPVDTKTATPTWSPTITVSPTLTITPTYTPSQTPQPMLYHSMGQRQVENVPINSWSYANLATSTSWQPQPTSCTAQPCEVFMGNPSLTPVNYYFYSEALQAVSTPTTNGLPLAPGASTKLWAASGETVWVRAAVTATTAGSIAVKQ